VKSIGSCVRRLADDTRRVPSVLGCIPSHGKYNEGDRPPTASAIPDSRSIRPFMAVESGGEWRGGVGDVGQVERLKKSSKPKCVRTKGRPQRRMGNSTTDKITVLQVVDKFLQRTEIFIYNYITAMDRTKPVILTRERVNAMEFPFNNVRTIPEPIKEASINSFQSKVYEKLTGKSLRWYRIERYIENLQPGLIHSHFGPYGHEMLPIKKKFNIPLITTFYGCDMSILPRMSIWKERYSELFSDGDLFLVEGPYMRKKLIEIGAPEKKVQIQRIGIHLDKYPKWAPGKGKLTILFVARFTEKKGLMYALEAVSEIKKQYENIEFRIIGDGKERGEILEYVKNNSMEDYTIFFGMVPHSVMVEEMAKANIFIHPSVTAENGDSEGGAPTILLEAQAIGIPIVTTRHADIPNIVEEGPGIYLTKERDVDGLVVAVRKAIENPLSVKSEYVKKCHDIKKEVVLLEDKYIKLYNERNSGIKNVTFA
jgi:colanic acid/amylovoran biosynthesis glycosyltransferase